MWLVVARVVVAAAAFAVVASLAGWPGIVVRVHMDGGFGAGVSAAVRAGY